LIRQGVELEGATREMFLRNAVSEGRYEPTEEERGDPSSGLWTVKVPLTKEERDAILTYRDVTARSNEMYPKYKEAKMNLAILNGRRMSSRYSGKSSISGQSFDAGTEIFYAKSGGKTYTVPVSEMEMYLSEQKDFLQVSLASTPLQAQKGFSNRASIDPTEGLLIPISDGVGIWMKDTTVPLSVAFLDSDYKVLQIDSLTPNDETVHLGPDGSAWALEASPEWFKSVEMEVADKVVGLRGGPGSGFHGHGGRPGERGGSAPAGSIPKKWSDRGWTKDRWGVLTREEGNKTAWIRKEIRRDEYKVVLKKEGTQWVREARDAGILHDTEADAVELAERFFSGDDGFIPYTEYFARIDELKSLCPSD